MTPQPVLRMRSFAPLLCLLTLLGTACGGRGSATAGAPAREEAPIGQTIVLTDSTARTSGGDTVRFGLMQSGEIAVKPLVLHNRTERPLLLTGTTQNCGCVSLEYDTRPIQAGERRAARLCFDARGLTGWQFKAIDLHVAGMERTVRLYVDVDVE